MSTDPHPDSFVRRTDLLHQAVERAAARDYWSPYPETPSTSAYGAGAPEVGEAAFRGLLGQPFPREGHPTTGTVPAAEISPTASPSASATRRHAPALAHALAEEDTDA